MNSVQDVMRELRNTDEYEVKIYTWRQNRFLNSALWYVSSRICVITL